MSDIEIRSYDFQGILARLTGTDKDDWEEAHGPDTGVGLDYWYVNGSTGETAWINLDQMMMEVRFSWDDEDDEPREGFFCNFEELGDEDAWVLEHVETSAAAPSA